MHVFYAEFALHNYVLKKIYFQFKFKIDLFAIKPITSNFSLSHLHAMDLV